MEYEEVDVTQEELDELLSNIKRVKDAEAASEAKLKADAAQFTEQAEEIITSGLRSLAKRYHPDVCGSALKMQQINATVERLRKIISQ